MLDLNPIRAHHLGAFRAEGAPRIAEWEVRRLLKFLAVPIGSGGVSSCVRCTATPKANYTAPEIFTALTSEDTSGSDGVLLTEFEPFAHPSLVELVSGFGALGVSRIGLQTDGAALGLGQNARGSISAGVRVFEFAFLGADSDSHDRLTGKPGSFTGLMAGIDAVKHASKSSGHRCFVSATVKVCRHNVDMLPAMVAAAAASGVRAIRLELPAEGISLDRTVVSAAHSAATSAGVALFGEGCSHILGGATLYQLVAPAVTDGERGVGRG